MIKSLFKLLYCTALLLLASSFAFAQVNRTITGTVSDDLGQPLPQATITVKGTTQSSSSDQNGKYSITVNSNNAVLVFTFIGYDTREVGLGSADELNVSMNASQRSMNEVVVTALGISKQKKQLGFSVTEVKGSDLARTNEVNPINALQGRVAGVQIDMGGAGGLTSNSKIVIRGNSTLGTNNQPVFVIDGVMMDNDVFGGNGRDFGNDLKNLNMEDFESVSVLKGSAAAALYGTRAVNGVILITTKKGKKGSGIGVSVNQSLNIDDPYAGPDFQNEFGGGTVGDFFTDNRDQNYKPNERWTTKVFPTDPISGLPYIDRGIGRELENWGPRMLGQEVINYDGTPTRYLPQPDNFLNVFQKGRGYNTNIAVDGGNEQSTFRLSYNRNDAEGVVKNNKLLKNAFDVRATHNFGKIVDLDLSVGYSDFNGENPPRLGGLDPFGSYNFGKLYSWMMPRNYDTNYWTQRANYTSKFGGVPNPGNNEETNLAPETRFWFSLYENNYLQKEQLLRGRAAITVTLTDWAKLLLEGNINNIYTRGETRELGQGVNFTGGAYSLGFQTKESNMQKWMLLLNKDVNSDISLSGYIGGESQKYKTTYESSSTSGGLTYPGNYFIANSVNQPTTEAGIRNRRNYNSLYASADIGYKDMLYLQATWRGDWSSALTYSDGSGNNFYTYPAVSLSWIFSETFASSIPSWISYGKLRGNIATLGGDTNPFKINPGFAFNGYSAANGQNVPISTYSSGSVLQPNLKPQRKISKELGAEMRFVNNRLGFDISFYQDNTKNQLLDITTPTESGVNTIFINAGNIQNRGIEISLDATPVQSENFSWNTALNYAVNRNKIVDLYPGRTEYNLGANIGEVSAWAVVGKSYGILRSTINSTKFQAVDGNGNPIDDPRNGLPILSWRGDSRTAFPARSNQWQDIGNINAKFRSGWDNTFNFKNLSLNFLLDAKIGGDFVALSYRYGTHTGVFPNSLPGRDAQNGGIVWTSKYANDLGTYDDGIIPQGVFAPGQIVDVPGGGTADVGGMTYQEAYEKNLVEPSHLPQYYYRYGSSSTGVSDYWVLKNSWVSLRQVAMTYRFSPQVYQKLKLTGLSLSVVGRNLGYLYNTLPYNFNPESNNSNNTAYSGEEGFLPMTRSFVFSVRASF
jgi:iron complex outermembrane receptor protein